MLAVFFGCYNSKRVAHAQSQSLDRCRLRADKTESRLRNRVLNALAHPASIAEALPTSKSSPARSERRIFGLSRGFLQAFPVTAKLRAPMTSPLLPGYRPPPVRSQLCRRFAS